MNFLSRDFPDYKIRENSINPTIAILTKYFEIELGVSFRFVEALEQSFSFHILFSGHMNILNFRHYDCSFRVSNFNLFRADNKTSLYYTLKQKIRIGKHWIIKVDIGLHDAGQTVLSSFFTSFYGQLGFRYNL